MPKRHAVPLAKNLKFERFYADWDEEQPAERLDPSNSEFLKTHPIESMTRVQPKLREGTKTATISRTEKPQ